MWKAETSIRASSGDPFQPGFGPCSQLPREQRGHRAKVKVSFFLWSDQKVPPGWGVGGGGQVSHGDKDKGADGRNCAET